MRKGLILGLLGVLALALLAAGTASVGADTTPPNHDHLYPYWNALQQGLISGTAITACSDGDFVSSSQAAIDRWNSALARTIFQHYCTYPQVWVSTANFYTDCQSVPGSLFPHACTYPTSVNGEQMVNPTYVRMNPAMFPGQGDDADGGAARPAIQQHPPLALGLSPS